MMRLTGVVLALMLISSGFVFGKPAAAVPMNVVVDDNAAETKLIVPRWVLAPLKAEARQSSLPGWHLIIAGGALAAAFALGGLWALRGRRRAGALVLVLTLALSAGVAGLCWANTPPPFEPERALRPGPPEKVFGQLWPDKIKIEVVEKGDAITLVVTSKNLTKVLDKR